MEIKAFKKFIRIWMGIIVLPAHWRTTFDSSTSCCHLLSSFFISFERREVFENDTDGASAKGIMRKRKRVSVKKTSTL